MKTKLKNILTTKRQKTLMLSVAGILILTATFLSGTYFGYTNRPYVDRILNVANKEVPSDITSADFAPFWKVWNLIDQKSPDASKVSAQDRVYGAISGLVGSLNDPYSEFFPPKDSQNFSDTIKGSFDGIGMEIGEKDHLLTVIAPLKGTPAEKAGIRAGDKILKINDKSTSDLSVDEAVQMIRGEKGTSVKLSIYHDGQNRPKDISVVRDTIAIPTLDTEKRDDGIFVIKLYSFDASSAPLMEGALRDFAASGDKKLVLDLRNNPGGYLDSAVDIASFFLPEGDTVVSEDFGSKGKPQVYRSKGFQLLDLKNLKMAVLGDGGSASASEILAGALQEHKVAPLIGEQTYGKGSVQEVLDVTGDTTMKITVAKWLTPNGISISLHGLTPNIPVTVTDDDITKKIDPIMNRAVKFLNDGEGWPTK